MAKWFSVRELAKILDFQIVGKLKRMPDERWGLNCHAPCYMDEAGNEYYPGLLGDVCPGCIIDAKGGVH